MIILLVIGFAAIWFGVSITNGARTEADGNGGIVLAFFGVVMIVVACVVSVL